MSQRPIRDVLGTGTLAGLFAGLCFSSSEGIRLLPFPAKPDAQATGDDSFAGKNFKTYSLSVHNSAVKLLKYGGNVQNNIKFFDRADHSLRERRSVNLFDDPGVRIKFEPVNLKNTGLSLALSDRAPPVV